MNLAWRNIYKHQYFTLNITNITLVFSKSFNIDVNLLSLYGIWFYLFFKADIKPIKFDKLLLINWVYFIISEFNEVHLSVPAKSIKEIFDFFDLF